MHALPKDLAQRPATAVECLKSLRAPFGKSIFAAWKARESRLVLGLHPDRKLR